MAEKLSSDDAYPSYHEKVPVGADKTRVRAMWKYVLEKVVVQGGPFGGEPRSEHLEKLIDTSTRLFPWGLPQRGKGWRRPLGVGNAEYDKWLRAVFGRTVPSPISYSGVPHIRSGSE